MYERFTDRSRKVMQLANQEAQRLGHESIGTGHILLGLVKEGSGVAANVLKNLDIDLHKVRTGVEDAVGRRPGEHPAEVGRLPHTPKAKEVVEHAIDEARKLNHNYVGTEHLLLGLLREGEDTGGRVLVALGLKLDVVRDEILNLLGHNMPAPAFTSKVFPPLPPAATVPLTAAELEAVESVVAQYEVQKEHAIVAQELELAASFRDRAEALKKLLGWYRAFHYGA